jgi:hypothetical protein
MAEHEWAAQVVLTPAVDPQAQIAANIGALLPPRERSERVKLAFGALGFRTGPVVGNSFSIEGDRGLFERTFHTRLSRDERGSVSIERGSVSIEHAAPSEPTSLPLDRLPKELREALAAVLFSQPPAFGPGHMP